MGAPNLGVVFAPCLLHHPDAAGDDNRYRRCRRTLSSSSRVLLEVACLTQRVCAVAMANNKPECEFVRRAIDCWEAAPISAGAHPVPGGATYLNSALLIHSAPILRRWVPCCRPEMADLLRIRRPGRRDASGAGVRASPPGGAPPSAAIPIAAC